MCVKSKIEFLFFLQNIFFLNIQIWTMKWKYYLKNGLDKYKYDCLKFKQYLSLTSNFFMVNISPIYGVT